MRSSTQCQLPGDARASKGWLGHQLGWGGLVCFAGGLLGRVGVWAEGTPCSVEGLALGTSVFKIGTLRPRERPWGALAPHASPSPGLSQGACVPRPHFPQGGMQPCLSALWQSFPTGLHGSRFKPSESNKGAAYGWDTFHVKLCLAVRVSFCQNISLG